MIFKMAYSLSLRPGLTQVHTCRAAHTRCSVSARPSRLSCHHGGHVILDYRDRPHISGCWSWAIGTGPVVSVHRDQPIGRSAMLVGLV